MVGVALNYIYYKPLQGRAGSLIWLQKPVCEADLPCLWREMSALAAMNRRCKTDGATACDRAHVIVVIGAQCKPNLTQFSMII